MYPQVSVDHPAAAGPQSDQQQQPASREYYLDDDECPLAILMNHHPARGGFPSGPAGFDLETQLIYTNLIRAKPSTFPVE